MRFEMELERMKQMHQKELEDKEEELEDVHKSSQRRVGCPNKHKQTQQAVISYPVCFVCVCVSS